MSLRDPAPVGLQAFEFRRGAENNGLQIERGRTPMHARRCLALRSARKTQAQAQFTSASRIFAMKNDSGHTAMQAPFIGGEAAQTPWRDPLGPGLDGEPEVGVARGRLRGVLSPVASDWMLGLPLDVRPSFTAAWYPHVINRLCELWPQRALREDYFGELLCSRRGGRRGFEALVMEELLDLRHYGTSTASH
jgi:hypothetical protein